MKVTKKIFANLFGIDERKLVWGVSYIPRLDAPRPRPVLICSRYNQAIDILDAKIVSQIEGELKFAKAKKVAFDATGFGLKTSEHINIYPSGYVLKVLKKDIEHAYKQRSFVFSKSKSHLRITRFG